MIGDVNIFLKGTPPWLDGREKADGDRGEFEAEVEVMIAGLSLSRQLYACN